MTAENLQLAAFLFFMVIVGPTVISVIRALSKDEDKEV
jgi:hypothetical protein